MARTGRSFPAHPTVPRAASPPTGLLTDNFPGTTIDSTKWSGYGTVSVANNTLTVLATTAYSGLMALTRYSLYGSGFAALMTPLPVGTNASFETMIALRCTRGSNPHPLLTTTTFTITVTGSTIQKYVLHVFQIDVAAVVVSGTGAYITGGATTVTLTGGTPSASGDYLWLGILECSPASAGTTLTVSSTGYTLIPTGTTLEGTSGGSSSTNILAKVGYQQVLASAAAQSFSGAFNQNCASTSGSIVALSGPAAAPPAVVGKPIIVSQAAMRAAVR